MECLNPLVKSVVAITCSHKMLSSEIVTRNESHSISLVCGGSSRLLPVTTEKRQRWMGKTSAWNRLVRKWLAWAGLGNARHMCVTQGSGAAQFPFCLSVADALLLKVSTVMVLPTLLSSSGDASCKALGWSTHSRVVRRVPQLVMDDWSLSSSCRSL